MEKVLKKVEEGVQEFDAIWDKVDRPFMKYIFSDLFVQVYSASQQSLKEKYESELKKEIKKLQRQRDIIKAWIGNNDIKDKTELTNARKVNILN